MHVTAIRIYLTNIDYLCLRLEYDGNEYILIWNGFILWLLGVLSVGQYPWIFVHELPSA
jgi:hypothetical protein